MLTAFFDRDGTIARDYPDAVWPMVNEVELMPGAVEAMRFLRSKGYEIIIVTNQYLIDENYITLSQYEAYTEKLLNRLKDEGIEIKDVFFCPHARNKPCACRKPAAGMVEAALLKYPDIDLSKAFMVGDSDCDIALAQKMNLPVYAVNRRSSYAKCITLGSIAEFEKAFSEKG